MCGAASRYFAGRRSTQTFGGSITWSSTDTSQSSVGRAVLMAYSFRPPSSVVGTTSTEGSDPLISISDTLLVFQPPRSATAGSPSGARKGASEPPIDRVSRCADCLSRWP